MWMHFHGARSLRPRTIWGPLTARGKLRQKQESDLGGAKGKEKGRGEKCHQDDCVRAPWQRCCSFRGADGSCISVGLLFLPELVTGDTRHVLTQHTWLGPMARKGNGPGTNTLKFPREAMGEAIQCRWPSFSKATSLDHGL